MLNVNKTVIVPYTPEQMFKLVDDVENYKHYLPWCTHSEERERTDNTLVGAVYLEYLKVKTHWVTKNTNTPFSKIEMALVDGPFKALTGEWEFIPLGDSGCKIIFNLHYKFESIIIEKIIGPVFSFVSKNIVDCFIKEANKKYGKTHS